MVENRLSFLYSHFFYFLITLWAKIFFMRLLIFEDQYPFYALLFEMPVIVLLFLMIEVSTDKWKTFVYYVTNFIVTTALLSLVVYYHFFETIPSIYTLSNINQLGAIQDTIMASVNPIYLLFYLDFILLVLFYLVGKYPLTNNITFAKIPLVITASVAFVIMIGNSIGVTTDYILNPIEVSRSSGVFTYQWVAAQNQIERKHSEDDITMKSVQQLKTVNQVSEPDYFGLAEDKHIIMIQFEALQQFVLHQTINGQEITPTLNQLTNKGVYFPNFYQQIGAGNTSDAEFIANTSLYPPGGESASAAYGKKEIPSLPRLLEGYDTLTFHANDISFWDRDQLYEALGFDSYYDSDFFGEEDVIGIGPSDDILFQKGFEVLLERHEQNKKFYSQFVTLSSHHPFNIPERKEKFPLPADVEGSYIGNYLQSIHYTDAAIGRFLEKLKQYELMDEILLVIYGDHFGLAEGDLKENDQELLTTLIGHEYHKLDKYNVPFIIYSSEINEGKKVDILGGQIDILPTVANVIGHELDDFLHFGQDLINSKTNLITMNYYLPPGSFLTDELYFVPENGFEDGKLLNFQSRTRINEMSEYEHLYKRSLELLKASDRYVRSLPER
ncbi:LTA synthase family protein [Desertibacillus haloalkaliphilus]|uniref:LTA synthase family protein n=1 Tax=Desertibacillus haloalkaliphilus TaxID=1328930 RepID=UPI001C279B4B|nr:LTA synthase family protein [Desertibacillus haloalkaliphilus]MBU8905976.1 LTA synthase family protein [Desertibacillus haloalkaliphilus]